MDKRLAKLMLEYQARQGAAAVIKKGAGHGSNAACGTYLVNDFRRRDELPVTSSLRKMSIEVAKNLAELGLREPISLQALPNLWWRVYVDAAEEGLLTEYGNGFVKRTLSTNDLMSMGSEVIDGPFAAWETPEVSRAILARHPEKFWDSRITSSSTVQAAQLELPFSATDDGHSSETLLSALDRGDAIQVFGGPYEAADDARYALDVRWEVPD